MRTQSLRNASALRLVTPELPRDRESEELLVRTDVESKRLFAAAMAGQFVCRFCSHPGPHDDIGQGQGSDIAFACAQCGKLLDESALKLSVNGARRLSHPPARPRST